MKKILLMGFIFASLCAYSNQFVADRSHFLSFSAGLNSTGIEPVEPQYSRFHLSYGTSITSQHNYFGFFEMGMKAPTALLTLKYGYEFMRNYMISFGFDTLASIGVPANALSRDPLGFTNDVGIFINVNATAPFSIFVRGGVQQETFFFDMMVTPYVDLGFRYYL